MSKAWDAVKKIRNKWVLAAGAAGLLLVVLLGFHFSKTSAPTGPVDGAAEALPLFAPDDKPMKVNLKGLDLKTGKWADFPVTIRESKSRLNQMKQAVLAFLDSNRELDIPPGLSLNEFYLTAQGQAVVDVSTSGLTPGSMGFYEELLFIRGLIETLTKNFSEVREIKLLVNGLDAPTLAGHYALGTSEAAAAPAAGNLNEGTHGNQ